MDKVAIFGLSGFASEVVDICDALGIQDIVLISKNEGDTSSLGLKVVPETQIDELEKNNYQFAIGIAEPLIREKVAQRYTYLPYINLIHPHTSFGRNQRSRLERCRGVIIGAGTRFMSSIDVGDFVVVSLNVTIGHDVELLDYSTIMPGANISGNVILSECSYVGSGAVVLQGQVTEKICVGSKAIVGAGAVLTKSCKSNSVQVGIPAKPLSC